MAFCFATFAKILIDALEDSPSNEKFVNLLFGIIVKEVKLTKGGAEFYSDKGQVSRILNQGANVPKEIKKNADHYLVHLHAKEYFENEILPLIRESEEETVFEFVSKQIENDKTISDSKIHEFEQWKSDRTKYLAEACIFSFTRENRLKKKEEEQNTKQSNVNPAVDLYYLEEVGFECPLCQKSLKVPAGEHLRVQHKIVQIFPENLNSSLKREFKKVTKPPKSFESPRNTIALCMACGDDYQKHPDLAIFKQLREMKDKLLNNQVLKEALTRTDLSSGIRDVVGRIKSAKKEDFELTSEDIPLSLNPKTVEDKMKNKNIPLQIKIQVMVNQYYFFVQHLFSQMESCDDISFNAVAQSFKKIYSTLDDQGLNQEEIVNNISAWIENKLELSSDYHSACEVVVAFFIQNCEVF